MNITLLPVVANYVFYAMVVFVVCAGVLGAAVVVAAGFRRWMVP